jgi:uncharacterized repeat protein (TIGR03803 family)
LWATIAAYALALLMIVLATQLHAQTYTVLRNFAGSDGDSPQAGLTLDRAGNLYGTTRYGGSYNAGTVFKVTRHGSGWIFTPLYNFTGGPDGASPDSRVVFGPDGSLYGTTTFGGPYRSGVVFKLQPSPSACKTALCPWKETVLYNFTGQSDGAGPEGDLVFDQAGNIYGTTFAGGQGNCVPLFTGCGAVYELTPSQGHWNVTVLHTFTGLSDGGSPTSGVILDQAGNLYGTTYVGGSYSLGTVFELTPSGSGWTENVLHDFAGGSDGASPEGGLTFDSSGDLYGVTAFGGGHTYGTAFELQATNGGFSYSILYNFGLESETPVPTLTLDSAGNLYSTAQSGGTGNVGAVFELTPSGASWNYTSLHDFTFSTGGYPLGNVILDAEGNLYGTTPYGGTGQDGVVFEITP